ncbi:MAG: hypothetical protein KC496_05835 [Anaerolineae bacterium]|nr:hypothetical protein [Anaerolineae bacterium]
MIQTVTGEADPTSWKIIDGHTHVWIEPVGAIDPHPLILNDRAGIERELIAFRKAGGSAMVDCQPAPACGRNGERLRQISLATGVPIIASTGFHLRRYYPQEAPIFAQDAAIAYQHIVDELTQGLAEAPDIRAGFIKIACEKTLDDSPKALIEAAVQASTATGAAIQVHTERGHDVEQIAEFMLACGQQPEKLILCHVDKRPDVALHQRLVERGIRLEYDTFVRPKYDPDQNAWPLLQQMIDTGYSNHIILATDLAEAAMWRNLGGGVGAVALIEQIKARLKKWNFSSTIIDSLLCQNIVNSLNR